MKKWILKFGLVSIAFGAGTVYGSVIGSGVAYSMMECEVVKLIKSE